MAEKTTTRVSQDILQLLDDDSQKALGRIAERSKTAPGKILDEINAIDRAMAETAQVQEKTERDTRQRVLNARLETLHQSVKQEEADLSQAVLGLSALVKEMGIEYDDLTKPSSNELSLIAGAEQRLAAAKQTRQDADSAWFFKTAKIQSAEQAIKNAEQGIQDAKAQAAQMARKRLMSASMAESLQEFMFKVQRTIEIMTARKSAIEIQIAAVTAKKNDAFRVKEAAAKKLEELDAQVSQQEEELKASETALTGMVNGSAEYVAQEKNVSTLRQQVELTRGSRNNAFVLFQSKERFAAELEVHEKAQMKLRENQRAWITLLTSDTQERVVTFQSRLEAMKAMSDQDVAKNLDKVGVEIDARNTEFMAEVGAASDQARMGMVESQPERVKRIALAQAAQAEAQQKIREREAEALRLFREKYGIDPLGSSFFTYQGKNDEPAAEPAVAGS